jgi:lipopolysaccharide/colanic/teichoic acid biosynthesis glycosyltransferase
MANVVDSSVEFEGLSSDSRLKRYAILKRMVDVVLVFSILPIAALLLMILFCLVGRSPIYRHLRVGRNGKEFYCLKVRSMALNSETLLRDHLSDNPVAQEEWRCRRKLTADPRVTRVGRFLRQTSLDELPQIFNVLKGEMTFVGPRPVPADELEQYYGEDARVYKAMTPGLTGAWQVSSRRSSNYRGRVALDRKYFEEMSLRTDLQIIAKTVVAVVRMTGE